jgi:hypothetical protein
MAAHPQTAPLVNYDSEGVWSLKSDSVPFNNAVMDFIRLRRVRDVLLVARWDYYVETDKGTERVRLGLLDTITALRKTGARVWIMRQVPKYPWNVPKALASAVLHGHDPETLGLPASVYRAQSQVQDPIFEGLPAQASGVTVLDPTDLFVNSSGRCKVAQGGETLYYDSDHVSAAGAMMLRPLFEPIFEDMAKNRALVQNNGGGQ